MNASTDEKDNLAYFDIYDHKATDGDSGVFNVDDDKQRLHRPTASETGSSATAPKGSKGQQEHNGKVAEATAPRISNDEAANESNSASNDAVARTAVSRLKRSNSTNNLAGSDGLSSKAIVTSRNETADKENKLLSSFS
ncbi:MAG: hypothetical protein M1820_004376 [Bogoriella megaspora]|nr:MAG: hypothetical protein M1820_004376 [Bogoriella megaspora]